ncbi:hypothetical protein KIV56_00975 [Cryobacterium breve]|uniref:Tetratricopeptide repeat protein n=1 Tax=Cryobacterium breve TaxID=1259258 RepID=A0ABY7NCF3_9MICO|nr:hypothetical protein [Cryobacterium breve]WBM80194.1 hypothetical protein KIV56_00975 [Cryobacterium breve]
MYVVDVLAVATKMAASAMVYVVQAGNKVTLNWRVGNAAAHMARDAGIQVSGHRMRQSAKRDDVLNILKSGSPAQIEALRRRLDHVPGAKSTPTDLQPGDALAGYFQRAYTETLPHGEALQVASSRTVTAIDRVVGELSEKIVERDDDSALMEMRLEKFHPLRAGFARDLRSLWPSTPTLIGRLTATDDRGQTLSDWAAQEPRFLHSAPPAVQAFLGQIAGDSGQKQAALHFYDSALADGISPRGFWKVCRMWQSGTRSIEEAREYLDDVAADPFVQAVLGDAEELSSGLGAWLPSSDLERATKEILLARQSLAELDFDNAILMGVRAYEGLLATEAGLVAVRALIVRHSKRSSPLHSDDATKALTLALRIRDDQRRWASSSAAAVVEAARAARLIDDNELAWRITQLPPEGEANLLEANSRVVLDFACLLAAEAGRFEIARSLVGAVNTPCVRSQVEALISVDAGDEEGAVRALKAALEASDDWDEKAHILFRLALLGTTDPFVGVLGKENPQVAKELILVASLFAEEDGALAEARLESGKQPRIAIALLDYYKRHEEMEAAARLASEAAMRWTAPHFWMDAAHIYQHLGDPKRAIECLKSALLNAGSRWGESSKQIRS